LLLGKQPLVPIAREAVWDSEPLWKQTGAKKKISSVLESNIDSSIIHNVAKQYQYSLGYPTTNKDKFTSSII
jgi:hypothetical protein